MESVALDRVPQPGLIWLIPKEFAHRSPGHNRRGSKAQVLGCSCQSGRCPSSGARGVTSPESGHPGYCPSSTLICNNVRGVLPTGDALPSMLSKVSIGVSHISMSNRITDHMTEVNL